MNKKQLAVLDPLLTVSAPSRTAALEQARRATIGCVVKL